MALSHYQLIHYPHFLIRSRIEQSFRMLIIRLQVMASLLLAGPACATQIFIEYGAATEGQELYKYFHDVSEGFFVDVGAYDAIYASNTLNLHTQAWSGLNVDASPQRIARFNLLRPSETNVFSAIGDSEAMLTLFEMGEDSSSTVSAKIKALEIKEAGKLLKETTVPSMDMKELCQRFFPTRPLFLNLDIEGYGSKALSGNDWKQQKCRPHLILSEYNQFTVESGLALPSEILKNNGYTRVESMVGLNQLYIDSTVYQEYMQKAEIGSTALGKKKVVSFTSITKKLAHHLQVHTAVVKHYDPVQDDLYYFFCQTGRPVLLDQINKASNLKVLNLGGSPFESQKLIRNRPIAVYHFNPRDSYIVVPQKCQYTVSEFVVQGQYSYYNVTVSNREAGSSYSAYILDHRQEPPVKPKIVDGRGSNFELPLTPDQILRKVALTRQRQELECPTVDRHLKKIKDELAVLQQSISGLHSDTQLLETGEQAKKEEVFNSLAVSQMGLSDDLNRLKLLLTSMQKARERNRLGHRSGIEKQVDSLMGQVRMLALVFLVLFCSSMCLVGVLTGKKVPNIRHYREINETQNRDSQDSLEEEGTVTGPRLSFQ